MPAPSVASFTTAYAVYNSGDVTINKPSGTASGDLLVAYFLTFTEAGYGTPTHEPPTGWTLVSQRTSDVYYSGAVIGAVYYKVAGGSEPATYTWGNALSARTFGNVVMLRITGADTTTPIDASANTNTPAPASNYNFPSVTTTGADRLILLFGGLTDTPSGSDWPLAAPSGFTVQGYVNDTTNGIQFGSASKAQAASGATGAFTVPFNDLQSLAQGFTIAVNPVSAASYTAAGTTAAAATVAGSAGTLKAGAGTTAAAATVAGSVGTLKAGAGSAAGVATTAGAANKLAANSAAAGTSAGSASASGSVIISDAVEAMASSAGYATGSVGKVILPLTSEAFDHDSFYDFGFDTGLPDFVQEAEVEYIVLDVSAEELAVHIAPLDTELEAHVKVTGT